MERVSGIAIVALLAAGCGPAPSHRLVSGSVYLSTLQAVTNITPIHFDAQGDAPLDGWDLVSHRWPVPAPADWTITAAAALESGGEFGYAFVQLMVGGLVVTSGTQATANGEQSSATYKGALDAGELVSARVVVGSMGPWRALPGPDVTWLAVSGEIEE